MEQPNSNINQPTPNPVPKSGSNPLAIRNLIPGMLIGVLLGIGGLLAYKRYLPQVTQTFYIVTLTTFGVLIASIILIYAFKRQITTLIFGSATANAGEVIDDAQKVTDALIDRFAETLLPQGERERVRHVLPRLTNWFIWNKFRNWWWQWVLGIFVSLGGITGTLLLIEQNAKIGKQTELLDVQNNKIEQQTGLMDTQNLLVSLQNVKITEQTGLMQEQNHLVTWQNNLVEIQTKLSQNQNELIRHQLQLEESNRRGALVVLMSNIMDKIDDEISAQQNQYSASSMPKFKLSQSLIGQIVALSHSFKPYRYLDGNAPITRPLSPERGQLLITLTLLPLDSTTLDRIYQSATFESADLQNAVLDKAYLRGANLIRANLSDAKLIEADLSWAKLRWAKLIGAQLNRANLNRATLSDTDFSGAYLNEAKLIEADLSDANLSNTNLGFAYLLGADFTNVNFSGASLGEADFSDASLRNVNLTFNQAGVFTQLCLQKKSDISV